MPLQKFKEHLVSHLDFQENPTFFQMLPERQALYLIEESARIGGRWIDALTSEDTFDDKEIADAIESAIDEASKSALEKRPGLRLGLNMAKPILVAAIVEGAAAKMKERAATHLGS